jgi:hypothetical protein
MERFQPIEWKAYTVESNCAATIQYVEGVKAHFKCYFHYGNTERSLTKTLDEAKSQCRVLIDHYNIQAGEFIETTFKNDDGIVLFGQMYARVMKFNIRDGIDAPKNIFESVEEANKFLCEYEKLLTTYKQRRGQ